MLIGGREQTGIKVLVDVENKKLVQLKTPTEPILVSSNMKETETFILCKENIITGLDKDVFLHIKNESVATVLPANSRSTAPLDWQRFTNYTGDIFEPYIPNQYKPESLYFVSMLPYVKVRTIICILNNGDEYNITQPSALVTKKNFGNPDLTKLNVISYAKLDTFYNLRGLDDYKTPLTFVEGECSEYYKIKIK